MNFIALLDGQCHLLILCAFRMKFYVTLIMRFYLFRMLCENFFVCLLVVWLFVVKLKNVFIKMACIHSLKIAVNLPVIQL